MALSQTGPIKFRDINTELGRTSTLTIALKVASLGGYAAINQNSTIKPDGNPPHSMSEWRGYDHLAVASTTTTTASLLFMFDLTITGRPDQGQVCIDGPAPGTQTVYADSAFPFTPGVTVYIDPMGTNKLVGMDLWYWASDNSSIRIDDNGMIGDVIPC